MKKNKLLVMMLVAVMLLTVGCGKTQKKEEAAKPSNTITNIADVTYVQCTKGDKTVTLEYTDEAWFLADNKEVWVSQSEVQDMVDATSNITPIREVKDAKDLSEYGLDEPTYTVVLKNENGEEVTLYIGDAIGVEEVADVETEATTDTAVDTATDVEIDASVDTEADVESDADIEEDVEEEIPEYYATTGNKDKVYVISGEIVNALEYDEELLIVEEVDPMEALKNMAIEEEKLQEEELLEDIPIEEEDATIADETPVEDSSTEPTEPAEPTE